MYERVVSNMIFYHLRTEHIEFLDFVFFWDTLMGTLNAFPFVSAQRTCSCLCVNAVKFEVKVEQSCTSC